MQRRAGGPPVALARSRPPSPPEAPGRPARRRLQGRARAGNPAQAPAALAHGALAAARGPQAGSDLPGGARGPAGSDRHVVVVDLPAVDRPGAMLRHTVRGQHQAVLVTRRRRPPWMVFRLRRGVQVQQVTIDPRQGNRPTEETPTDMMKLCCNNNNNQP
ncbi:unnamed protein product [Miscanthus lutarioriparius]|uniref:Uncharacterized protein n=1 Tax=Miscanthus lutarioriparius TaxID=422564 RepID=A0A811PPX4_9POAL|nr:unnamed protein product [Miscanthus lutarioriparius]